MGRRNKQNRRSRPYYSAQAIEDGIVEFYRSLQLSTDKAAAIRDVVVQELAVQNQQAARDVVQAKRQHARLENERQMLLEAHYAGAVPIDMLKREMTRMTRELSDADTLMQTAVRSQEELTRLLDAALSLATRC